MTLNANFPGAVQLASRPRLEGPERALDALVGLVIVVTELIVGLLSILALYAAGSTSPNYDQAEAGFAIALFGAGIAFVITTIVYLVRIIVGRRSWSAPLWGLALITAAVIVGFLVMSA